MITNSNNHHGETDMTYTTKSDMIRSMIFEGAGSGQVFTATFVKKDGSVRDMNCRLGVKKHLKGGESTTAHISNLLTVFDMQAAEYRCINLDTVTSVRINGNTVAFS